MYLVNLFFSIFYSYIGDKYKHKKLTLFLILILWSFIIGFQYNVGSDYFAYLKAFENKENLLRYFYSKEYIFYYFIYFYQKIFLNGQYAFFIIAILQNYLFYKILKLSEIKKWNIFLILFLCVCTVFHNQMNILRQSFVIYLFTIIVIYIIKNEYLKSILFFLIGLGIHKSIFLLFPFLLVFKSIKKLKKSYMYFFLILTILFIFIPIKEILFEILKYTIYREYILYKDLYFNDIEVKYIFSKLIYLPFYLYSIKNSRKFKLDIFEKKLYDIGVISYVIKIITLKNMMLIRIGDYFTILSLFPLYYCFENLYKTKQFKKLFYYLSFIILIYVYKVITFYKYNNYFFK